MEHPMITGGGEVLRTYDFGPYSGVLIGAPESFGPIKYIYVLIVFEVNNENPVLFVTSEKNEMQSEMIALIEEENPEMASGINPDKCFLGIFSESGHDNLGGSISWCDLERFEKKALEIIKEILSVDPKINSDHEGDISSGEHNIKPDLFSQGYRICDAMLIILVISGPSLMLISVNNGVDPFTWFHFAILAISIVGILGLLRVGVAFAVLALPFFLWAAYSVIQGFFMPPEWSDLVSPVYVGKWAISIFIEYSIGAYFWKKYSGTDFLEWLEQKWS